MREKNEVHANLNLNCTWKHYIYYMEKKRETMSVLGTCSNLFYYHMLLFHAPAAVKAICHKGTRWDLQSIGELEKWSS